MHNTDVNNPDRAASRLLGKAVEKWRKQMTDNQVYLTNHSVNLVMHALAAALTKHLTENPQDSLLAIRLAVSDAHQFALKRARHDGAQRRKRRRVERETQIRTSPLAAALAEKKLI
jgi:4-hydroxyphenylpyruvate dioxygenase-like putative hemolysin